MVDLVVTASGAPDPVLPGGVLRYTITIENKGSAVASEVVVTDSLPIQAYFVSALPTSGTCSYESGIVTCELGNLAVLARPEIAIAVRPTMPGTLHNAVSAASHDVVDQNPGNNTAVTTTRVSTELSDISFGEPITGVIETLDDRDEYAFTADVKDRVLLRMTPTSAGLDGDIRVYDPEGGEVCKRLGLFGNPAEMRCELGAGGVYTVLVGSNGAKTTGSYELIIHH
jgi:uncharacterized repeat protein (TIGR01451 family)